MNIDSGSTETIQAVDGLFLRIHRTDVERALDDSLADLVASADETKATTEYLGDTRWQPYP